MPLPPTVLLVAYARLHLCTLEYVSYKIVAYITACTPLSTSMLLKPADLPSTKARTLVHLFFRFHRTKSLYARNCHTTYRRISSPFQPLPTNRLQATQNNNYYPCHPTMCSFGAFPHFVCITVRQGPTLPKWLDMSVRPPIFVALPYAQTPRRSNLS